MSAPVLAIAAPIPPIPGHQLLVLLVQLAVLLAAARALGALAARIGMPAVVGELTAGVLLGPSVLSHLIPSVSRWLFPAQAEQLHLLDGIGQLGVLLLVGLAGMQLDMGHVRRNAGKAAKVSLGGLLIPLALGVGVGLLIPVPLRPADTGRPLFAMFLGVAICVTAIPVIAKTLMELKLTHRDIGQLILTAGVIDDAAGWLLLSMVSAMATSGLRGATIASSLGWLALVLVFAAFVGRPLVRTVMRRAEATGDSTIAVGTAVMLLLLAGAGTQAMNFEAILGSFFCGILIGSCGVDLGRLAPLNTLVMSVLAPIFFASVGLRMDLSALTHWPVLLAALGILAVAIVGKFLGAALGGWGSGLSRTECVALGAGMNARGVIQVIIALVGLRLGVLGTEAYTVLILVAIVTSVMAAPILRRAMAGSAVTEAETHRHQRLVALTQHNVADPRAELEAS
ncbi:cation:proton antiporter [Nocardia terpenica]|uniref:Cation:proton antiporter n=1 Tax=Nocardia terpenica TaxID=455432 RepID=A0A6G9YZ83_9NOCA|nr:cation:proton antiporter [Nocardia terpenica]QIS18421.1 cation:proton antiporter [Nocardia terpenica]